MKKRDLLTLSLIVLLTTAISITSVLLSKDATWVSWLEALGAISGAACVWLTVKENVWNFPISLLNVITFSVVYFNIKLYADASLQVVYVVLTLIGWYLWLFGGTRHTPLRVARASRRELSLVLLSLALLTLTLWNLLHLIGGSATFFDALTTSLSLCAQWLLNRKRLENWIFWIAADTIYVPLFIYKGIYLTSALYAVFLLMAILGLVQWLATWQKQQDHLKAPGFEPILATVEATP